MRWVLCIFSTLLTVSLGSIAKAGESEKAAIAYCIKHGATQPAAFAYCVGKLLTEEEIKKCLTGGDCFGENNAIRRAVRMIEDIGKWGPCGGPGSDLRHVGICPKVCAGPKVWVTLENRTNRKFRPKTEGKCSREERVGLRPYTAIGYGGVRGDRRIDFFSGGLGDPRKIRKHSNWKYAEIAFRKSWNTGHWRLYNGLNYAIVENDGPGSQVAIIIVTPRYGE